MSVKPPTGFKMVYINLDRSSDRREYMNYQISQYGLDIERFPAIGSDFYKYAHDDGFATSMLPGEIGCTLSHLHLFKKYRGQDLLVFEDDVDLSLMEMWPFTLDEFIEKLPEDWEIVQLYKFPRPWPAQLRRKNIEDYTNEWSSGSYLIKAELAERLIKRYFVDDKVSFKALYEDFGRPPLADYIIYYNGAIAYTTTLFTVVPNISTIQGTPSTPGPDPVRDIWSRLPYSLDYIIPN